MVLKGYSFQTNGSKERNALALTSALQPEIRYSISHQNSNAPEHSFLKLLSFPILSNIS